MVFCNAVNFIEDCFQQVHVEAMVATSDKGEMQVWPDALQFSVQIQQSLAARMLPRGGR